MEQEKSLREAGENYLETILELEDENGDVRSVDVATALGVSRPSVNKAIGILKSLGYVEQEPYGSIRLTDSGRVKAEAVLNRHNLFKRFLINVLAVEPQTADEEACRMEHVFSEDTMKKFSEFIEKTIEDHVSE